MGRTALVLAVVVVISLVSGAIGDGISLVSLLASVVGFALVGAVTNGFDLGRRRIRKPRSSLRKERPLQRGPGTTRAVRTPRFQERVSLLGAHPLWMALVLSVVPFGALAMFLTQPSRRILVVSFVLAVVGGAALLLLALRHWERRLRPSRAPMFFGLAQVDLDLLADQSWATDEVVESDLRTLSRRGGGYVTTTISLAPDSIDLTPTEVGTRVGLAPIKVELDQIESVALSRMLLAPGGWAFDLNLRDGRRVRGDVLRGAAFARALKAQLLR